MEKIRKIYFVRPSIYADNMKLVRLRSTIDRLTIKNLAEMAIPLLAAYVPSHICVDMVDDCMDEVNFDTDADVIAITAWLIHKERAIDIATEFKRRRKIVLIGGYLATMHPDVVQPFVDSVCVGEGDQILPRMLEDIEKGRLQARYVSDFSFSLNSVPTPRYDLLKKSSAISLSPSMPIQATRGCPFACAYCSVTTFYKHTYRLRPIADVIRDIKATNQKQIHFIDDNLMQDKEYAKELFRQMKNLKVLWGTQTTIKIADDPELLKLAHQAGCRMVMLGMETVSQSNLDSMKKNWAKSTDYKAAVKKIQDAGIGVHALLVFGFPNDTVATFENTARALIDMECFSAEFFILTPYPATPIGKKYLEEGKVFDQNLAHYREPYVVFFPENMTPKQLQNGYWQAYKVFYSLRSIFFRTLRSKTNNRIMMFVMNIYYWYKLQRKIVPTHFNRGNYLDTKWPELAVPPGGFQRAAKPLIGSEVRTEVRF